VKYLLDVNALVALGFLQHEFHARVSDWVQGAASREDVELATCPITELGFVRVLTHSVPYALSVAEARELLSRLRAAKTPEFRFIVDDHDVSRLPGWVKTANQTTDGHLAELARANGAILATLDHRIARAFLIPGDKQGRLSG